MSLSVQTLSLWAILPLEGEGALRSRADGVLILRLRRHPLPLGEGLRASKGEGL